MFCDSYDYMETTLFTHTDNTTLLSDVAGTVKPECCTCSQGRFCNKIAGTMLQNIHGIELFAMILGTRGYTCNRSRLLSQNSFEDVELPVRAENCRYSQGFMPFPDGYGSLVGYESWRKRVRI